MILYAPNINSGGGLVLLVELLRALQKKKDLHLFLDERIKNSVRQLTGSQSVFWVSPSIKHRLIAERKLTVLTTPGELVLCFNGVPPLFSSAGRVVVFIQNKLLITNLRDHGFRLRTKLRLAYERAVLLRGRRNVTCFLVQTASMRDAMTDWLVARGVPDAVDLVQVAPFASIAQNPESPSRALDKNGRYAFCYVADGQPHKNHGTLFEAMRLLAEQGFHPRLAVTLDHHHKELVAKIDELNTSSGTKIENLGALSHGEVFDLYANSDALVFPSLIESFGLPLIEADRVGLPIVASELDYVRDVCMPSETFNPEQPRSLSRALRRFMGVPEATQHILNAEQFLDRIP